MKTRPSFAPMLVLCSMLLLAGCDGESAKSNTAAAPAAPAPAAPAAPVVENFGDFQFEIPSGWTREKPDRDKLKAFVVMGTRQKPEGMIMVDVGKPALPTANDVIKKFTGKDGTPTTVDGVEAVRGETKSTDLSEPRHVVALMRDGRIVMIMAAGASGTNIGDAYEQVLKTWRWTAPK